MADSEPTDGQGLTGRKSAYRLTSKSLLEPIIECSSVSSVHTEDDVVNNTQETPQTSVSFGSDVTLAQGSPLLCLGMARTGTASLGAALNMLGIDRVHHGMTTVREDWQWEILERAADATFSNLPSYTGKPFTRADWDELLCHYDAATDIASFYANSLIAAYPDAKVILVERDIDRWHQSIRVLFEPWTHWTIRQFAFICGPMARTKSAITNYKLAMGWTGSAKPKDLLKNSRAAYVKHYEDIRASVPPQQLLEYKLTDGWEPLAAFLGKSAPGPDVKFPHINDAAEFERDKRLHVKYFLKRMARDFCSPRVWIKGRKKCAAPKPNV
ncbi:hypothetical protein V2A60_004875 [Cordyceps javanica]|uniref:Nad dependent epimerase n=1 Tax=Cordyceps javanica TaxID=43265 RepID=A0A545VCC7_9HYPO|nr:nad dependent epimerase [Cordyceps javanica]TQW10923.1 nad dependent epimerase [Cordyceps javanica]